MTTHTETTPEEALREQLGEIELQVLTGYTLADAIREGSTVTDKLEGGWRQGDKACAFGAAHVAAKARGYI